MTDEFGHDEVHEDSEFGPAKRSSMVLLDEQSEEDSDFYVDGSESEGGVSAFAMYGEEEEDELGFQL